MKKINPIGIIGYEFNELNKNAKNKAIDDHIDFWMECREYDEKNKGNFEKATDKAESMGTPWFTGNYIFDYCEDEIIEEIETNKYLFDENGDLLPLTYYLNNNNEITKIMYNDKFEVQLEG